MLALKNITLNIAGRCLINDSSINIPYKAKVGFIGHNGSGKSSLFKVIRGEVSLAQGSISLPRNCRLGWVKQEVSFENISILENLIKSDTEREALLNELEYSQDSDRIAYINERLVAIDAYGAPFRAQTILNGLGFTNEQQQMTINSFSGGMKMRVALAATLLNKPDILLLDEPSNYLDLEGVIWLEQHIKSFHSNVVLISHDRDLLNNCCNHILNLENQKLNIFSGNYDSFIKLRSEKLTLEQKQAQAVKEKKAKLESFITRFRAKASKAKQAQSRIKILEKLSEIEIYNPVKVAPFNFPKVGKLPASPIFNLENITLGYGEKIILKKLNLRLDNNDRIALLGSNGNGKSTFAKFLASKLTEISGSYKKAKNLKIAYFEQHNINSLQPTKTSIEHMEYLYPELTEAKRRAILDQLGINTEKAATKAEDLSGGEKARLAMGIAVANGAHLLILDEPTNHLDIDSRQALIQAINDFDGAIVMISHDQYLIEACAEQLWLVKDNTVSIYNETITQYKKDISLKKAPSLTKKSDRIEKRKQSAKKREAASELKKQIKDIECKLATANEKNNKLLEILSQPETYKNGADITKIKQDKHKLEQDIANLEEKWLALSETYETQILFKETPIYESKKYC